MSLNPYSFLFYILYKFIKLTTSKDLKEVVPNSATNLYLICLTNNLLTIIIFTKPFQFIAYDFLKFAFAFAGAIVFLYFFNEKLFLRNNRYIELEQFYDKKLRFRKRHFILLAILYIILSIGTMIWAGINFTIKN